jgi:hypothetical protein
VDFKLGHCRPGRIGEYMATLNYYSKVRTCLGDLAQSQKSSRLHRCFRGLIHHDPCCRPKAGRLDQLARENPASI